MKKLNVIALALGAMLFTGMGVTTLSAEGMKCGAGKCGAAMNKPVMPLKSCDTKKCDDVKKCDDKKKCDDIKNCDTKKCDDKRKCGSK